MNLKKFKDFLKNWQVSQMFPCIHKSIIFRFNGYERGFRDNTHLCYHVIHCHHKLLLSIKCYHLSPAKLFLMEKSLSCVVVILNTFGLNIFSMSSELLFNLFNSIGIHWAKIPSSMLCWLLEGIQRMYIVLLLTG